MPVKENHRKAAAAASNDTATGDDTDSQLKNHNACQSRALSCNARRNRTAVCARCRNWHEGRSSQSFLRRTPQLSTSALFASGVNEHYNGAAYSCKQAVPWQEHLHPGLFPPGLAGVAAADSGPGSVHQQAQNRVPMAAWSWSTVGSGPSAVSFMKASTRLCSASRSTV